MGLSQDFRFTYESPAQVQEFLRGFGKVANIDERGDLFVFTSLTGADFVFDCAIMPFGLRTHRAGEYFTFLGQFVEALTSKFVTVAVEDT